MYRGRFWTMRQYAGFASAEESNERYRYLLKQGQTGLSVAFDLPTQIGYDADDPMALGEVGKVGVSISSLADMEVLFREIPLDRVSTSMTINAPAAVLLAMYIAVARRNGVRCVKDAIDEDAGEEEVGEHHDATVAETRRVFEAGIHQRERDAGIGGFRPAEAEPLPQQAGNLGDIGVGVRV